MQSKKNIVLVDDHVIVRNGLKELVEKLGPYQVYAQYDGGRQIIDALPLDPAPDLVIMDLSMPGLNGDEVMEHFFKNHVELPVLILTLNEDEDRVVRVFRMGARGYLKKDCTADVLRQALESILQDGYYHNEFLSASLRQENQDKKKTEQQLILEKLSTREKEFLKWVCDPREYTYKQIAVEMNIELRTVDGYREAIFAKFGIKSKTGLVLFIIKHRLYDFL